MCVDSISTTSAVDASDSFSSDVVMIVSAVRKVSTAVAPHCAAALIKSGSLESCSDASCVMHLRAATMVLRCSCESNAPANPVDTHTPCVSGGTICIALVALLGPIPVSNTVTSCVPMFARYMSNSRLRPELSYSYGTNGCRDFHGLNSASIAKVIRNRIFVTYFVAAGLSSRRFMPAPSEASAFRCPYRAAPCKIRCRTEGQRYNRSLFPFLREAYAAGAWTILFARLFFTYPFPSYHRTARSSAAATGNG